MSENASPDAVQGHADAAPDLGSRDGLEVRAAQALYGQDPAPARGTSASEPAPNAALARTQATTARAPEPPAHEAPDPAAPDPAAPDAAETAEATPRPDVPASPEGYDLGPLAAAPGDPVADAFRSHAHALGLTQAQARGVAEGYAASVRSEVARSYEQGQAALKKDWGRDYDRNLALAGRAVSRFCPPDMRRRMETTGLANDPAVAKLFLAVGSAMSEDTLLAGAGRMKSAAKSPAEILYAKE